MGSRIQNWLGSGQTKGQPELEAHFAGRPDLNDEAFYSAYFGASNIDTRIVIGVRQEFMKWLPFDMTKLAPDDSFKAELNFVWRHDSLADVELLCAIEKRFDVSISNEEARDAASMGNIIRLVHAKLAQNRA